MFYEGDGHDHDFGGIITKFGSINKDYRLRGGRLIWGIV